MKCEAKTKKIIVLGLDGMDPSLTKKFMDEGKLPNIKKFVERGAQREDLVMLGGLPTITPPLWTTLATGAYPGTHGITCFWNQDHDDLSGIVYNLDSRMSKAEPLWNVSAEAGKKTLVWHWPGSAWPPSSTNPNLYVVDGAQPAAVQMSAANVDTEKFLVASEKIKKVIYKPKYINETGAGCVIEELEEDKFSAEDAKALLERHKRPSIVNIELDHTRGELSLVMPPYDVINSPIKPAEGWVNAPEGAKEFSVITDNGLTRRPALVLKNAQGIYDRVAIYQSKNEKEPLFELEEDKLIVNVIDKVNVNGNLVPSTRSFKVLEIAPDGSEVRMWLGTAYDINNDERWHPKQLYRDVIDNVGYVPCFSQLGGKNYEFSARVLQPVWQNYAQWQADALNYLIEKHGFEIIFSHLHMIDAQGHIIWSFAKEREDSDTDPLAYQKLIENCYIHADEYIGSFLHLLDEEWTVIITSDHGLVCRQDLPPLLGDPGGVNVRVMQELGFTALKKDESGNELAEIDWEKTIAVNTRSAYIWLNLKGRNPHGIVDPADKYEVEEKIIDALYGYRDPKTGKGIVSLALRNKDAVILGLDGPETGDIVFFLKEGNNRTHGDCLPTAECYFDTSISPIFIAAGKGLKEGFTTTRVIREVDLTPTMAVLAGLRMPAQCEGAPVYQILED
ncbi:MAG: nucleotide pyrophosphatase [Peptococcaceae bacterium BICA1-7]|nr:MAG: nucleotide pyrophosphatase [Peptococcaceae bacterium BICA1-7]HBV95926.1 nucleotide pyrophosphatase [Desulfotomaculum sp.]